MRGHLQFKVAVTLSDIQPHVNTSIQYFWKCKPARYYAKPCIRQVPPGFHLHDDRLCLHQHSSWSCLGSKIIAINLKRLYVISACYNSEDLGMINQSLCLSFRRADDRSMYRDVRVECSVYVRLSYLWGYFYIGNPQKNVGKMSVQKAYGKFSVFWLLHAVFAGK